MKELRFDDQVAIVTGSGRGLGAAYASLLAARGAAVVVNDLGTQMDGRGSSAVHARKHANRIQERGGTAEADESDISTAEGAQALVDHALKAFGQIDIVVNNAGIYWTDSFPDIQLVAIEKQYAVHVGGSFNVARAAWPHMERQQYGRVVMTASTGAFGSAALTSYGAAKAGIIGLGRALAMAGSSNGIKVNIVAPNGMSRMMVNGTYEDTDLPQDPDRAPELVAPLVAVLCHRDSPSNGETYISGMGRVSRMFIGESRGYVHPTRDLAAEDLIANWEQIEDLSDFEVCQDTVSWSRRHRELAGLD